MVASQFQLITGETAAGRFLRKMLPISYLLQGACLVCILLPAAHSFVPIVGVPLLIVFVCVALLELSNIKRFHTSGVIRLSDVGISLDNELVPTNDLQQVQVKFTTPRGQGVGSNGIGDKGNRIIIYPKVGNAMVATVLVEARVQRDTLATVLKIWRKAGIKVSANGIDLA